MIEKIILLVDDNPDDVHLALHAFHKMEYEIKVVVANDGLEALDYLFRRGIYSDKSKSRLPSLILLDLKMPRVNGLEVLQQIRDNARTKFIPTVILTSSKEEQDIIDSYTMCANSYIRKPIDFSQFSKIITIIANYWLFINEIPEVKELF